MVNRRHNVSYSSFAVQKAVSVPLLSEKFTFGTKMQDPVWDQAVRLADFVTFPQNTIPGERSELRLFQARESLYLAFFFTEQKKNMVNPGPGDDQLVWHGDMAELHFGAIFPEPWLLQLAVGIGGGRFDSAGAYQSWRSLVFVDNAGWYAEIEIPLCRLPLQNGGLSFNLCRQAAKRNEFVVWSPLTTRFHEVENFGTLLFCNYDQAYFLRTGKNGRQIMMREAYETIQKEFLVKATSITHGPYLSNPTETSMTITWETAGRVAALLEYNRKGSDRFLTMDIDYRCGTLLHQSLHVAALTGLEPNTDYEYRLVSLSPVTDIAVRSSGKYSFRTLDPGKEEFSFVCISDLHSNVSRLQRALDTKETRRADFLVLLGDSLSHAAGKTAVYDGLLDPLIESYAQEKPLVFVRGNHEMIGIFADEYFNCMRHPSGRTWYTFRHGKAFFIVLDSGIDHEDPASRVYQNNGMWQEEQQFLRQVVSSEAYSAAAFRIVFMHIPPYKKEVHERQAFRDFTAELFVCDSIPPPHMIICGHIHCYARTMPGEGQFTATSDSKYRDAGHSIPTFPCTVIANSNETVLEGRISTDMIVVRIFEPDGNVLDEFSIPA